MLVGRSACLLDYFAGLAGAVIGVVHAGLLAVGVINDVLLVLVSGRIIIGITIGKLASVFTKILALA